MPDQDGRRLDLRSLLAAVEVAPPVAAVDVFAAELGDRLGAEEVSFLISDFNGSALVRLSQHRGGGRRSQGVDAAETVPLAGTPYEHVVRTQRLAGPSRRRGNPGARSGDGPGRRHRRAGDAAARGPGCGHRRLHRRGCARARIRGDRQPALHRPVRVGPAQPAVLAGRRDPTPPAAHVVDLRGRAVHRRRRGGAGG